MSNVFLFDFDGLLVNTDELHFQAYVLMCKRRGYELEWDYLRFWSLAHADHLAIRNAIYTEIPSLHKEEPHWEVLYAEKKQAYLDLLKEGNVKLMPGVEYLLATLDEKGAKRCVATNSTREQIELIKGQLPILNSIPLWITREDYAQPKPYPDAYLTAIGKLAVSGDRIIGFEDSVKGLKALIASGAEAVWICDQKRASISKEIPKDVLHFSSFEECRDLFFCVKQS